MTSLETKLLANPDFGISDGIFFYWNGVVEIKLECAGPSYNRALAAYPEAVVLEYILIRDVKKRSRGLGGQALGEFCGALDACGLVCFLHLTDRWHGGPSNRDLRRWYERYGWEQFSANTNLMRRLPNER